MEKKKFNDFVDNPFRGTNTSTEAQDEAEKPGEPMPEYRAEPAPSLPETAEEIAWPTSAPEPSYTPQPISSGNWLTRAKAYLPEYAVMLILLSSVVFAVNTLVGIGIDALIAAEAAKTTSSYSYSAGYADSFVSFQLVWSLAVVVIALPLMMLLYARTKGSESEAPAIVDHRWRKGFLGVFVAAHALSFICVVTGLAFDLLSRLIDTNGILGIFGANEAADPWWQITLILLLNAALIGYVVMAMAANYRRPTTAAQNKSLAFILIVVSIIAVGMQFPAIIEQRNKAEDQQKSQDITTLRSSIETYAGKESELPSKLSNLDLDDKELEARLANYEYTAESTDGKYKICTTFKTEAKGSGSSYYPAVADDSVSTSIAPDYKYSDPYTHGKGKTCFDYQSYSVGYSYPKYPYDYGDGLESTKTPTNQL